MTSTPDREPSALAEPRTICPYLLVATGHWRNAEPSRDHVCTAEAEVVPIGLETQRRLCFGDHEACRRHEDAVAAYRAAVPLVPLRPIARTTPVVIDRGRPPIPLPQIVDRRALGQAVLALAMIGALAALLVARLGPGTGAGGPSGTEDASASAIIAGSPTPGATATLAATTSPPPSATTSPSPAATTTPRPTVKPSPSGGRTYTVRPGDTLSSIAARFGTTVKALQKLNGITDPSLIHPGQVLRIP
jgi:LysM repeat protein